MQDKSHRLNNERGKYSTRNYPQTSKQNPRNHHQHPNIVAVRFVQENTTQIFFTKSKSALFCSQLNVVSQYVLCTLYSNGEKKAHVI